MSEGGLSLHVGVSRVHVFRLLIGQLQKPQNQQIAKQQEGNLVVSTHRQNASAGSYIHHGLRGQMDQNVHRHLRGTLGLSGDDRRAATRLSRHT